MAEIKSGPVITISRQYGSGGREVGKKLAEALGLTYYDKEIIAQAAEQIGLDEDSIEKASEQSASPFSYLFSYATGGSAVSEDTLPLSDRVFIAQSRIIKKAASEGGCVIIGRCSDYVLEGEVDAVNILVRADWEARVVRVMERNNIDRDAAIDRIKRIDKRRAAYYQHYTGRKWSDSEHSELTLSTTPIGIDGAVELISHYLKLAGKIS